MGYSVRGNVWVNDEDGQVVTDPVLGQKLTNDYNREKKVPISTLASLANSTNLLGTDTQKMAESEMQRRLSDGYMDSSSNNNLPKNKLSTTPVEEQGWFQMGNEKPESVKDILMKIDPKLVDKTNKQVEFNIYDQLKKVTGMEEDKTGRKPTLAEINRESLIKARDAEAKAKTDPELKRKMALAGSLNKPQIEMNKQLEPYNETVRAFDDLEKTLGFKLDKYDPISNNLPGVSTGLGGKRIITGEAAAEIENILQRIMNSEIKKNSGAATSAEEIRRNLAALGKGGTFQNEATMISAFRRLLGYNKEAINNILAANDPEVVSNFKEQGGVIRGQESSVYDMTPEQRARRKEELLAKKNKKE